MYQHKIQYYETDKMLVTHHSNYIRWMEEARVDFLDRIGWSYMKLEELGIISPVISVDGDTVTVKVGSVEHPSLDTHYIEWIVLVTTGGFQIHYLKPGMKPEAVFRNHWIL